MYRFGSRENSDKSAQYLLVVLTSWEVMQNSRISSEQFTETQAHHSENEWGEAKSSCRHHCHCSLQLGSCSAATHHFKKGVVEAVWKSRISSPKIGARVASSCREEEAHLSELVLCKALSSITAEKRSAVKGSACSSSVRRSQRAAISSMIRWAMPFSCTKRRSPFSDQIWHLHTLLRK